MGDQLGKESFSVLFWNIWTYSQLRENRRDKLHARFDSIIQQHRPEAIGLNEVIANEDGEAPLLKHLQAQGYKTFFAPFSPERNGQVSGSALATIHEPTVLEYHELGPDITGAKRGYPGHTVKLIRAQMAHGSQQVSVVVNYLAHLVPYNWTAHVTHHKSFRKIMQLPELSRATIVGGDFNQFKFIPRLWSAGKQYNRATGTILSPTWKFLGKVPGIQANYDNIFWTKCGTFKLQEFRILERTPSDHAPLLAKFLIQ